MKNGLEIVAWFWICMALLALLDLVFFSIEAVAWFYSVNRTTNAISDIIRFILFMLGGVGLMKRKVFGWWILVIVSGYWIINITVHLLMTGDDAADFVMVLVWNTVLIANLITLLKNRPGDWHVDDKTLAEEDSEKH